MTTKSIAQGVEIETLTKRLADHKERKEQLQTQLAQVRKFEKGRWKGYNKKKTSRWRKGRDGCGSRHSLPLSSALMHRKQRKD